MSDNQISRTQKSIDFIIRGVANRGWEERESETDQFSSLRNERQFRDAQVVALYEQYFLPGRHEFEWQILSDIAQAIVTTSVIEFVGLSIMGGVIGNAAYDLIGKLCNYVADQFEIKLGERARERANNFRQIGLDAEKLKLFFEKKDMARIEEIEKETHIAREKIYPLMKLAGFNHHRRKNACNWGVPK